MMRVCGVSGQCMHVMYTHQRTLTHTLSLSMSLDTGNYVCFGGTERTGKAVLTSRSLAAAPTLIGLNDHCTGHISSVVYSGKTMEAGDDSSLIGRYAIEWGRGWGEATGRVETPRIWAPGISGQ